MIKLLYTLAIGLICAVIIHIALLIVVPAMHHEDIWGNIRDKFPVFHFSLLEKDDPINNFKDPLFLTAACPFDLTDGPVHFISRGQPAFWSMSVYTPDGNSFYNATIYTAPQGQLNYILANPEQAQQLDDAMNAMITAPVSITNDMREGFIMLRVFVPNDGWQDRADKFIENARCQPVSETVSAKTSTFP